MATIPLTDLNRVGLCLHKLIYYCTFLIVRDSSCWLQCCVGCCHCERAQHVPRSYDIPITYLVMTRVRWCWDIRKRRSIFWARSWQIWLSDKDQNSDIVRLISGWLLLWPLLLTFFIPQDSARNSIYWVLTLCNSIKDLPHCTAVEAGDTPIVEDSCRLTIWCIVKVRLACCFCEPGLITEQCRHTFSSQGLRPKLSTVMVLIP